MKSNILWQDNEAGEKMVKIRKMSCSSKYMRIGIKFFWVEGSGKQGNTSVKHCPTETILADFFTKHLKIGNFNMPRKVIMGWYNVAILWDGSNIGDKESSTSKECI